MCTQIRSQKKMSGEVLNVKTSVCCIWSSRTIIKKKLIKWFRRRGECWTLKTALTTALYVNCEIGIRSLIDGSSYSWRHFISFLRWRYDAFYQIRRNVVCRPLLRLALRAHAVSSTPPHHTTSSTFFFYSIVKQAPVLLFCALTFSMRFE